MSRLSDPRRPAMWRERFERFSSSGLPVGRFCAREGVSTAAFYHWRKRLGLQPRRRSAREDHGRPPVGPAGRRGRFQQVAVVGGTLRGLRPGPAICIQLPGGTRIEVGAEDLDAVRTVLAEVVHADRGREPGAASC